MAIEEKSNTELKPQLRAGTLERVARADRRVKGGSYLCDTFARLPDLPRAEVVSLPGEKHSAPIRIMAPEDFLSDNRRYDLIVIVDSITEFAPDTAARYAAKIATSTPCLLSINHEGNSFRVHDLFADFRALRFPHWMRPGYVEELVYFG